MAWRNRQYHQGLTSLGLVIVWVMQVYEKFQATVNDALAFALVHLVAEKFLLR
jgi:hypothetical protein